MAERTSMQEETDEDLLLYMAFADMPGDKTNADDALKELHRRYVKRVYARCRVMFKAYDAGESMAEELTQATFSRAYERAETYKPAPEGVESSSWTLGWLCKIASRIFLDFRRNPERPGPLKVIDLDVHVEEYSPEDFAGLYCEGVEPAYTHHEFHLVAEAFDTLDERTQIVLVETLVQRQRSPGRTYMLRGTSEALAARINTSTDNLRQIRSKGIKKISEYVAQHQTTIKPEIDNG